MILLGIDVPSLQRHHNAHYQVDNSHLHRTTLKGLNVLELSRTEAVEDIVGQRGEILAIAHGCEQRGNGTFSVVLVDLNPKGKGKWVVWRINTGIAIQYPFGGTHFDKPSTEDGRRCPREAWDCFETKAAELQ